MGVGKVKIETKNDKRGRKPKRRLNSPLTSPPTGNGAVTPLRRCDAAPVAVTRAGYGLLRRLRHGLRGDEAEAELTVPRHSLQAALMLTAGVVAVQAGRGCGRGWRSDSETEVGDRREARHDGQDGTKVHGRVPVPGSSTRTPRKTTGHFGAVTLWQEARNNCPSSSFWVQRYDFI